MKTLTSFFTLLIFYATFASAQTIPPEILYTTDFRIQDCKFQSTGVNPYFNITPGTKSTFKGEEDGVEQTLELTFLNETEQIILPGLDPIEARVYEERSTEDGVLVEVSRNFVAICDKTNDVYYFGEDVDFFHEDGPVTHEGAWKAGVANAKPGIIMPGTFLLGSRYFQEQAPGVALGKAENVATEILMQTEAGNFEKCVKVFETSVLEPDDKSNKVYCPDVGLVLDDVLKLTEIQK